jgi:rubredoxin
MSEKDSKKVCPQCGAGEEVQDFVTSMRVSGSSDPLFTLLQCRKCKAVYDPELLGTGTYDDRFKPAKKLELKKKEDGKEE